MSQPSISESPRSFVAPGELSFHDVLSERRSIRSFRPDPIPEATLRAIVQDAQRSPSNCNTQPWQVHLVSGEARDRLSAAILADWDEGRHTPDFTFDTGAFHGPYGERQKDQGATYYQALGLARNDQAERQAAVRDNLKFFGAPHVAFLFMPSIGDNVRVASDVGMYAQTFLLTLVAHGFGGIPQTMLGYFADTIRNTLGVPLELKLLFGISFGLPDETHPANRFRQCRAPIEESVVFHT